MKLYKQFILTFGFIAILFCAIVFYLHYICCDNTETQFYINICLAIFGSALLTTLSAWLSYCHERKKTLINFYNHTLQIIRFLNNYKENMTLKEKVCFFLDYYDFNKDLWANDYGDIDFLLDKIYKHKVYIQNKIFLPIIDFGDDVQDCVAHFRWYLGDAEHFAGLVKPDIIKLENIVLSKQIYPQWYGHIEYSFLQNVTKPKLAQKLRDELNGHYYEIMVGKRKAKQDF